MKVGGYVFEDYPQGKEEKANGVKDSSDLVLPNVEVALYVADENGNIKLDKNGKRNASGFIYIRRRVSRFDRCRIGSNSIIR